MAEELSTPRHLRSVTLWLYSKRTTELSGEERVPKMVDRFDCSTAGLYQRGIKMDAKVSDRRIGYTSFTFTV